MDRNDDMGEQGQQPEEKLPQGEEALGVGRTPPRTPRPEKKRIKVSLLTAIIVNLVTLLALGIALVAVFLPGYRRSFNLGRAVKGADSVWVVVKVSQSQLQQNKVKFEDAQESVKRTLEELVGVEGSRVFVYVRDSYPPQTWVEDFLPEDMRKWLRELYPKAPSTVLPKEETLDGENQGTSTQPGVNDTE